MTCRPRLPCSSFSIMSSSAWGLERPWPRPASPPGITPARSDRTSRARQSASERKIPEPVREDLKNRGHVLTATEGAIGGAAMLAIDAENKARGVGPAAGKVD